MVSFLAESKCSDSGQKPWTIIRLFDQKLRGALAGHPGDRNNRRSGGSNSEAQWRITLRITFIGDLEGQTQRRNGGSHYGSHS